MARISRTHAGGPATGKAPRAGTRKKAAARPAGITPEERYLLIAETAYYRAERRSFSPGHEIEDWLDAETEVERMIARGKGPTCAD